MPRCRKCTRNVVKKPVTCETCGLVYHEGCLQRFVSSRLCKLCCKSTYNSVSAGSSITNTKTSENSERDTAFDSGRDLDSASLLDISDLSISPEG